MRDFIHKYIYIIVGGLIFWLVLIPLFFTRTVSVVCENLTYNTPFEIIIKKPRLYTSLIPTAFLKAEKITIKSKNNNDKYEFLNPKINLRILPLISGKIHINDFYLSEIIIESKTDNENLSFYKNSHNLKIICDKLKIDNLKVNIKDNAQNTLLTGKNIYYKNNINYLDFSTSSLLKINNETSNIDINFHLQKNKDIKKSIVNCNITNLNIKYFEKYLSVILPKNTTELRGIVDISTNNNNVNFILRKCALINKDSAKSIILPKILNIESYFKITNKFIQIKDTKILSDNINVTLNGDILEYLTKQPKLDLNLQINKSKVYVKVKGPAGEMRFGYFDFSEGIREDIRIAFIEDFGQYEYECLYVDHEDDNNDLKKVLKEEVALIKAKYGECEIKKAVRDNLLKEEGY